MNEERHAKFLRDLVDEFLSARQRHRPIHSGHEAYGVIMEEVCEFFDYVRAWKPEHSWAPMRKELLQIAAMCWRTAFDLGMESDAAVYQQLEGRSRCHNCGSVYRVRVFNRSQAIEMCGSCFEILKEEAEKEHQ